jgi:exodeoxyribonuclease V alpha subunit
MSQAYAELPRPVAVRPDRSYLLVKWLAADPDFEGIGLATARKLAEAFGDRLHSVLMARDAEALIGIIDVQLAKQLLATYYQKVAEAQVIDWLDERGFDAGLAFKVVRFWGEDAADLLNKNPYLMLTFAGWEHVDGVALGMGIDRTDNRRLIGAVEAVIYRRLEEKHTVTSREWAVRAVQLLLGSPQDVSRRAVALAVAYRAVMPDQGGLQPIGAAVMEQFVANRIRSLRESPKPSTLFRASVSSQDVDALLAEFEIEERLSLTREQREAVRMAISEPVSVLTGGAGVGKTTVLKAMFLVLERLGCQVQAIALAGRAAKRISELTGRLAMTIAACLCAMKSGSLRLASDSLVIVDEASMLDLPTMYRLLRFIPEHVRFLFVGDPYQLPPIGFGLTFHLWAEAGTLPTVSLRQVHRQAFESGIPTVANAIREGRLPFLDGYHGKKDGVSFIEMPSKRILDELPAIVSDLELEQCQIISPLKRGIVGVENVNAYFHRLLAIAGPSVACERLCQGEPILWTRNDWQRGFMNGSMGRVLAADTESNVATVELDGQILELGPRDWPNVDLAYAVTVHKAQGSQFDRVAIPVTHNRLLDRTLLYTAVTRGVHQVVLIGDRNAFNSAVIAAPSSQRRQIGSVLRLG